jgi:4-diphosphocytidyl-2-C-methyl-D-erythritol kinase
MDVHRSTYTYVALAPAKLNLFFEVLEKRADGYHEVLTCVCPIQMYDTLWFRPAPYGELHFSCRWMTAFPEDFSPGDLPPVENNLAYKALELLRRRKGVEQGAEVMLVKSIPSGSGLGGASSDAAAVLQLANLGWKLGLSADQLSEIAAELGSDVPLFFANGLAICRGRGEKVSPLGYFPLYFVVVRPPAALATAQMYRYIQIPPQPRSVEPLLSAIRGCRWDEVGRRLFNRFQEVAADHCSWIERLQDEFGRLDLLGHGMTGSGTAYFGLCRSAVHARWVAGKLRQRAVGLVWAGRSARGIACWVEESSHGNHRGADQARGGARGKT